MHDPIETHTTDDGHTIEIFYDDHPESPRDWGHSSTFWTFHSRYCSPDPNPDPDFTPNDRDHIWLPVWMYDHSGVAYAAAPSNPFHCPWDSGCVGLIWISKSQVRHDHGWKRITKAREDKILSYLKSEVETYSQWANGEVYGYVVKDADDEEVDSCWGFYGMDYCLQEAEACI